MAKFIKSIRNRDKLIFRGFAYTSGTSNITTQNWVCERQRQDKCKGSASTRLQYENDCEVVEKQPHNHIPDIAKMEALIATDAMKNAASTSTAPPRRIISEVLMHVTQEASSQLGKREALRKTIQRKRRRMTDGLEPLPVTRNFAVPERFQFLTIGENNMRFLLHDDYTGEEDIEEDQEEIRENRILVFGVQTTLDTLEACETILLDGTFKVCPQLFFQLFTIHGIVGEWSFPCLFCLLPDKTQETYHRLFNIIKNLAPRMNPRFAIADFEIAIHNSIRRAFPNCEAQTCYFHFSQNIWRQVQQNGLAEQYIHNPTIRSLIKRLASLPFLPIPSVEGGFEQLEEEANDQQNANVEEVFAYFEDTYIGRPHRRGRRAPRFAIEMWNVRERTAEGIPRTQNKVEGWHNALQSQFDSAHPSMWKFLSGLQKETALVIFQIRRRNQGENPPKQKKIYETINIRIRNLTQDHENGRIAAMDFLRGVSHNLHLNV